MKLLFIHGYAAFIAEIIADIKKTCPAPLVMVEQQLDFTKWVPDGFGTADCVIVGEGILHVVDLKYGKLEVSAVGNPQMRLYTNPQLNCNYIRFYHTGSCPCYVDYGHVENGVYIVDSTDSGANTWTSPLHLFTPDNPEYPVIRLRSDKATAFRQNSIAAVTKANSPNGIAVAATNCDMQYVLEVRGAVPTMTNFSSSNGNPVYGGRFCKRIKLLHCQKITSMAYAFQNNVLCESLELSADQPAQITGSMGSAFTNCMSLHSLDLSILSYSHIKAHHLLASFLLWRCFAPFGVPPVRLPSLCLARTKMPAAHLYAFYLRIV